MRRRRAPRPRPGALEGLVPRVGHRPDEAVAERAAEGAYLAASAAVRASFATLNRARAGSLTPAQKQQVNELLEAMMRGDVVM